MSTRATVRQWCRIIINGFALCMLFVSGVNSLLSGVFPACSQRCRCSTEWQLAAYWHVRCVGTAVRFHSHMCTLDLSALPPAGKKHHKKHYKEEEEEVRPARQFKVWLRVHVPGSDAGTRASTLFSCHVRY